MPQSDHLWLLKILTTTRKTVAKPLAVGKVDFMKESDPIIKHNELCERDFIEMWDTVLTTEDFTCPGCVCQPYEIRCIISTCMVLERGQRHVYCIQYLVTNCRS